MTRQVEVSPNVFKDVDELTPEERDAADRLRDEKQLMADNLEGKIDRLRASPALYASMRPPLDTRPPLGELGYWQLRHVIDLVSLWAGDISPEEAAHLAMDRKPPDRDADEHLANDVPSQKLYEDFKEAYANATAHPDDWDAFFSYEEAAREFNTRLDIVEVLEESLRREREQGLD